MVFSSILFIFAFLPIALGLYTIIPKQGKNLILLLISLFFYAWGEPIYVFLMLFTITFDWHGTIDGQKAPFSPEANFYFYSHREFKHFILF